MKSTARICLTLLLAAIPAFVRQASAQGTAVRQESIVLKVLAPNRFGNGSAPGGVLYTPADRQAKTVVLFIHPESDSRNPWQAMRLVKEAGVAAFGMTARYAKEDMHLIMEETVLDLAEAIRFLKQERGFTHVILHGHSGGGSTVAFYQQQATLVPPNRVKSTPAGDPPNLNEFDLPKADGLIISAAHLGRGWAVARKLDPSVIDEDDLLSTDYSLDPFNPENGYRPPPEWSHYSKEFLDRFATAQAGRMQRLIQKAYSMVNERKMYQKLLAAPDFKQRPPHEQLKIGRGAIGQRYMTIYRTYSNLMYNDASVSPNDRLPGAAGSRRTDELNYFRWYHPRLITPEAFLSSESTESNVYSPRVLPVVKEPILVIIGTADPDSRISESKAALEAAGASADKEFVLIEGADHGYLPYGPKAGKGDQRDQVIRKFSEWLGKRFPK